MLEKTEELMILAGDIGGTHTRLALFEHGKKIVEKKFRSPEYPGLEAVVEEFLREENKTISKACFGIAGPVFNGRCKTTNLPWIVDAAVLSQKLKVPTVRLINDLEANAYGLKVLKKEELCLLQKGEPAQTGNKALIAAGTGLGEAGLFWDGKEHHPFACEGGHSDFAARNQDEWELFCYLEKKFGHVSYERVLSGAGLCSIFQFLVETRRVSCSAEMQKEMKNPNFAKVISEHGVKNQDPACLLALDWFISFYGAEAGNLALKCSSLAGLYVGGGIAPRILEKLKKGPFLRSFLDKGRFHGFLESIPVWVVLNDDAALLGAAECAEK